MTHATVAPAGETFALSDAVELVETVRNGFVESRTAGAAVVTGPDGQSVTEGPLERDGSQVIQPLAETGSEEGTYQVVWRVVSSDGHPIEGTYTYEVGDSVDITTPAPTLSTTPTETPTGEGADSSDSSAQAQDAAVQENSGSFSGWAVGATVVVLALAVIGLLGLMSRRRRKN